MGVRTAMENQARMVIWDSLKKMKSGSLKKSKKEGTGCKLQRRLEDGL